MTSTSTTIFPVEALETNRSGALTVDQRAWLTGYVRVNRGPVLLMGLVPMVAGAFMIRGAVGAQPWWAPVGGVVVLAVGVVIALHALGFGNRLVQDLRAGRVDSVEGAIRRQQGISQGRSITPRINYLIVEGRRYAVGPAGFDAAPAAGYVRLFYLPRSRRVVNLEVLPPRAASADVLRDPTHALRSLAAAVLSGDATRRAEAFADVAGAETVWRAQQRDAAAAAETTPRESRPLAEAIVGRWEMGGLARLDFRADGTVVAWRPIGGDAHGRWSVDADGRLRSDVTGQETVGDARIAGDVLTLSLEGTTLSFRRTR